MLHLLGDQSTGPLIVAVPVLLSVIYFGVTGVRSSLAPHNEEE